MAWMEDNFRQWKVWVRKEYLTGPSKDGHGENFV